MTPTLAIENVNVAYGAGPAAVQAMRDVTLTFHPGQVALVRGPSGSGKTTLLSVLGCLLNPDRGSVRIMETAAEGLDQDVAGRLRSRYIGYVFQAFRLFKSLTALENVLIALEIGGRRNRDNRLRALQTLESVGVAHRAHLHPDQLSGGEKQRVAIARALVNDPLILLADEPTASLDHASGEQVSDLLRQVSAMQGRIAVVVSHDDRWLRKCDRVITMSDGRVIEDAGVSR